MYKLNIKSKKNGKSRNSQYLPGKCTNSVPFLNPFLKSLRFHQDGILNIVPHSIVKNMVFTGSADGEICLWLLNKDKCFFNFKAHDKSVRGLSINFNGKFLLSCSDDTTVKLWKVSENKKDPLKIYKSRVNYNSIKFNPVTSYFITAGDSITLWDFENFIPIQQIFQNGVSVSCAKFNPIEHNIILSSASDRSVMLHDLRLHSPVKKFFMDMRTNDIVWFKTNPWEFTLANEDGNLYGFDIRKINNIKKIYKGHVMPIQSLDQEEKEGLIISGSLDRTVRIFKRETDFESNVFASSRMSRVLCVSFSSDSNLILSGSEEGNLRVWKRPQKSEYFQKESGMEKFKNAFTVFPKKPFLPKLLIHIKKIKMKLKHSTKVKNSRLVQNALPGAISFQNEFKRPLINLQI